jgi:glycosyltransferase involved in cell wall biosynthesis
MLERRVAYLSGSPFASSHETAKLLGARAHILGTIQGFRANSWEVRDYIFGDRLVKWARRDLNGVGSARSSLRPFLWDIGRIGLSWVNNRLSLRELGDRYDLVYERYGLFQSLGRQFQQRGVPWILETNSPMAYEAKHDRHSSVLLRMAERHEVQAYQQCNILVCVSNKLKDLIVHEYRIDPGKMIVIPNGVNTEIFDPMLYKGKRRFEGFTVGFVGSLHSWQDLSAALTVLRDLRKEGKEINFVVVGDGQSFDELQMLVTNLRITEYVHFTGRIAPGEIPAVIAGFDVGFSGHKPTKKSELYFSPLKLYEYMAMAKPVVASASEDALALIRDKQTGFLFTPGNQDELKVALDCAYQARSSLPVMGHCIRQLILQKHSWTAKVRYLLEQVSRLIHFRPYGLDPQ